MGEFECKIKEPRNILILSLILSVSKLERAPGVLSPEDQCRNPARNPLHYFRAIPNNSP